MHETLIFLEASRRRKDNYPVEKDTVGKVIFFLIIIIIIMFLEGPLDGVLDFVYCNPNIKTKEGKNIGN